MPWWMRLALMGPMILRDEAGDGKGAGGGGAGADGKNGAAGGASDAEKTIAELKASNAALIARMEKIEKGSSAGAGAGGSGDGTDLDEKARLQREADAKKGANGKALEAAIGFNMSADKFLKDNAGLLPKDVADIFKAAEAETYNSAIEKSQAIKAGVIKTFFAVQSNLDLLTPSQKSQLEEYLKLTNTGRAEKALQLYDSIFEPTFEQLRRLKKAEALSRGHSVGSGAGDAYRDKLESGSKKHYLRERK